jgi:uncharacterized repeat protein (TIGR01451 family)
MSASLSPRPLAGLAAAALVVGLVGAPLVAHADPTPTPSPTASAESTPSPTPTTESPSATTSSPSASSSPTPTATASPSETESPSGTPSSSDESTSDESASTGPDASSAARVAQDAIEVPGPTESAAPATRLGAQAVAGPSITLAKSASPTRVSKVGQVVTYRFVATNNGSVALTGVGITDELEGLTGNTCPSTGASLAPGQALTCSASLTVTQAILDFGDVYNFATVFGSFAIPESPETDYVGANAAARVTVDQSPSIALKASVSPTGTADRGDRLRYRATATNTGNVTLTGARVTSSLDSLDLDCEPSARATLAPGASISCAGTYRVTTADARRGRVTNELTARAEPPYGASESSSDDITDDVRLRVNVTKVADDSDPGLADTGGPALPIGLAGLTAVAVGLGLIRRARRA